MKASNVLETKLLLTERDLARVLALKPTTLQEWRSRGYGPPYLRLSGLRMVRYPTAGLKAWILAQCGGDQ